jgi:acyl-CoA thioesterase I
MRDVRLCVLGDSFVAGVGDTSGLGWVGRLAGATAHEGIALTTYNLGVRRETTPDVAARAADEVRPRLAGVAEPRVVLATGVNDTVVENGTQRVSTVETLAALTRIVQTLGQDRAPGPPGPPGAPGLPGPPGRSIACGAGLGPLPLLLVGPPPVEDPEHDHRVAALSEALTDRATELGVPFVDTYAALRDDATWRDEVAGGDGYHPGPAGYERLAQVLVPPVGRWLTHPTP